MIIFPLNLNIQSPPITMSTFWGSVGRAELYLGNLYEQSLLQEELQMVLSW